MPPKKTTRSSSTKAAAKKKQELSAEQVKEVDFLREVDQNCSDADLAKVLSLFNNARAKKIKDILVASCEAIGRISSGTEGLMMLREAGAVEMLAKLAADPPEAGGKYTIVAVDGLCAGVVAWMDAVDPVEFQDLNHLLYFALWLGGVDEDVAVASCFAIEKFALYEPAHAAGMLEAGLLRVLHGLLAVHRGPEYVEQVFSLLYLLCDLPEEVVSEPLMAESELLTSIVELMADAPLNMRLQLTGLRLLSMLSTRLKYHEVFDGSNIPEMIRQANPAALMEDAVQKLDAGGFPHYSSWLSVIGRRALVEDPGWTQEQSPWSRQMSGSSAGVARLARLR